jgi:3-dehydroquinate dehydratase-2
MQALRWRRKDAAGLRDRSCVKGEHQVTTRVLVLNGPNLNLLGERETAVYGTVTLADVATACHARAQALGLSVEFRQTNAEAQLIEWIHEARQGYRALILNAGAYSHTSIAILDALRALPIPIFEVHLSNIHRREPYRHRSFVSEAAVGVISGCGPLGYALALEAVAAA